MAVGIEMDDLHEGVHTGIRAARTQGGNRLGREYAQRFFKFVLNGQAGALALPPLVGASVVANTQCNPHGNVTSSTSTKEAGLP